MAGRASVRDQSRRTRADTGCRASTLVELLAAISVVAVLAGLLVVVAASCWRVARRVSCTNQMKQLAAALLMYRDDCGAYPPSIDLRASENGTKRLTKWSDILIADGTRRDLFVCPSFSGDLSEGGGTSYEYFIGSRPSSTPGMGSPEAIRLINALHRWTLRERVLVVCKHHDSGWALVGREDLSVRREALPDFAGRDLGGR